MSNERVVCAACGSNNFATQSACWKCGKPLVASATPPSSAPQVVGAGAAAMAPHLVAIGTDSPAALWSSVALGVVFPMISIPVGLVFLMLDDRRKAQIGWWNIIFGLVGTLLNGIVMAATIMPLFMSLTKGLPGLGGLGNRAGMSSQDPNAEVPPLDLPGQRPFSTPPR